MPAPISNFRLTGDRMDRGNDVKVRLAQMVWWNIYMFHQARYEKNANKAEYLSVLTAAFPLFVFTKLYIFSLVFYLFYLAYGIS